MIQVQDLSKSFDNRLVVRSLSFTAPDGAITGLLGANGAGKTTTLRMICGVLQPESGSVTLDDAGADADAAATGDPLVPQRRLGALLDHMGIYPRLTVRENLAYFGMLRGMPPAVLAERMSQVLVTLGLEAIADRRTAGFSQGERMKTALGRAILHAPKNLLLDEPTNGVDVPTVRSLRDLLRRWRDAGACVVFSSHVLEEVRVLMRSGRNRRPRTPGGARFARRSLPPNGQRLAGGRLRKTDLHRGARRMLSPTLVVARKEAIDSLRDTRSVISSLMYALMGPAVVFMVSMAARVDGVLIGMMSVFTLVAAFVGGMNVAMDTVAGERERRSLLPLLMNPVRRREIVLGKWLAVGLFSFADLILNLAGFAIVFASAGMHPSAGVPRLLLAVTAGILPLALLAASLQLLISTVCRAAKEAQTYLSMLVFLPMGLGMFQVFFPAAARGWFAFLPVMGSICNSNAG